MTQHVTLIEGDGVGPEVIHAAVRVVEACGVDIAWEKCDAGARVFRKGLVTGVPQETIDSLKRTKIALKGPLETPIGYGEKSANVTLRVLLPGDLEFHANAVVQWVREGTGGDGAEPGFGARFTQITPEGRQLVYRYTRNREPIFYDDL